VSRRTRRVPGGFFYSDAVFVVVSHLRITDRFWRCGRRYRSRGGRSRSRSRDRYVVAIIDT